MKNLLLAASLLLTISCGQDSTIIVKNIEQKKEELSFQGYFLLDGGSDVNCIYLTRKETGLITIESDCFSLVTVNPENDTLGQFPNLNLRNLPVIDGKIVHTQNINYSSGNDIEEDVSGSNITGSRRTDIVMEFADDKLNITLKIYKASNNNNLNEVVAERNFKEI